MRVLLIEPDRVLAETYFQTLRRAKHQVTVCSSAQAAILAADKAKPDVVILELQLVGHSGIEFLYEFRSYPDWQGVPVVINTHVPPSEFAGSRDLLMSELNIAQYLYKPQTSLQKLLRTVSESAPALASQS